MKSKTPNWIPDWQNQDNYPDPSSTSPQEWAWEYLRRNSDYQVRYEEYKRLISMLVVTDDDLKEAYRKISRSKKGSRFQIMVTNPIGQKYLDITPAIMLFRQQVELDFMVRSKAGVPDPAMPFNKAAPQFLISRVAAYSPKVKLMLPIEGDMISQRSDLFFDCSTTLQAMDNSRKVANILKKPTEVIFSVDLSFNYIKQLEQIKKILNREKKALQNLGIGKRITLKADHDPDLLVVYDADLLGVRKKDIAQHVIKPIDYKEKPADAISRIVKMIKRARELVQHDYIKFLAAR